MARAAHIGQCHPPSIDAQATQRKEQLLVATVDSASGRFSSASSPRRISRSIVCCGLVGDLAAKWQAHQIEVARLKRGQLFAHYPQESHKILATIGLSEGIRWISMYQAAKRTSCARDHSSCWSNSQSHLCLASSVPFSHPEDPSGSFEEPTSDRKGS